MIKLCKLCINVIKNTFVFVLLIKKNDNFKSIRTI